MTNRSMKVIKTDIPDVLIFEPRVFEDERGFFMETFRESTFQELGINERFIQDNHSRSTKGVLRGLHYQIKYPQGKLVRVIQGEVFDVAVDLRKGSKTYGKYVSVILSAENKRVFWVPPGFAHGFLVLSDTAEFVYKCTDYYASEYERTLIWNDEVVGINWPNFGKYTLSAKDEAGLDLSVCETY